MREKRMHRGAERSPRERMVSRPEIPTVSEMLPGVTSTGWVVLVAPPRTPSQHREQDCCGLGSCARAFGRSVETGCHELPKAFAIQAKILSADRCTILALRGR